MGTKPRVGSPCVDFVGVVVGELEAGGGQDSGITGQAARAAEGRRFPGHACGCRDAGSSRPPPPPPAAAATPRARPPGAATRAPPRPPPPAPPLSPRAP